MGFLNTPQSRVRIQQVTLNGKVLPPHIRTSLYNFNVLHRAVEVVLLAVLADVGAHAVLEFDGNDVLRDVQVRHRSAGQRVAKKLPSFVSYLVILSNI